MACTPLDDKLNELNHVILVFEYQRFLVLKVGRKRQVVILLASATRTLPTKN